MTSPPAPLSLPRLLALHLAPGALATLIFVILAGPVEAAGYPPLAALLVAIAAGILPFELGVILLAGRREVGSSGMLAAVRYRRGMRRRDWIILVPALLVAAIVGFGLLSLAEQPIRDGLFGWLPAWFVAPVPPGDPPDRVND